MKKIVFSFLLALALLVSWLIYDEFTYNVLDNNDFAVLFEYYDGSPAEECSEDLVGFNSKGEFFDIAIYKNIFIDIDNKVDFKKWKVKLNILSQNSNWSKCPLTSEVRKYYESTISFILNANNNCDINYKEIFESTDNYYSCLFINEQEHYLLIYLANKERLVYIQRKGF